MSLKLTRLFRGSLLATFGTVVGGVLSFGFNLLMGRLLGPRSYGDLGAIVSMLGIVTAAAVGLMMVVTFYTANLSSQQNSADLQKLQRRFTTIIFIGSGLIVLFLIIFLPQIVRTLTIQSRAGLMVALVSVIFSYVIVVNRGILQGLQRFGLASVSSIIELALKLGIALVLVRLGYGILGATWAILLSLLFSYLISFVFIRDIFTHKNGQAMAAKFSISRQEILIYTLPTLLTALLLTFSNNIDILLIKRSFASDVAGQYYAVSSVAKSIFYFAAPISSVMFPMVTEHHARGEQHYQILVYALLLTGLIGGVAELIFYLFPTQAIHLLYGAQFVPQAHLLPLVGWFVISLSMVNLMAQYYLSTKRFFYIIFFVVGAAVLAQYALRAHPDSIVSVIHFLQSTMAILFLAMLAYYLYLKRNLVHKFVTQQ